MTQTAFVSRIVDKDHAEVLVQRSTACGGNCASCGGACSANSRMYVVAVNHVFASVGDKVTISSGSAGILSVAALVYLLPLALLLIGYAIGAAANLPETPSMLISLLFFAIGIVWIILYGRRKKPVTFEIIERL